jgi:hypothetical protein
VTAAIDETTSKARHDRARLGGAAPALEPAHDLEHRQHDEEPDRQVHDGRVKAAEEASRCLSNLSQGMSGFKL